MIIEFTAVSHEPKYRDSYAIDAETFEIRIHTKKGDVDEATLLFGDQFEMKDGEWVTETKPMHPAGSSELYDYWAVQVSIPSKRLRYGFIFENEDGSWTYTEKGWADEPSGNAGDYFCFPFLNAVDMFTPPEWVKDTVWYQIFPERFANGDPARDPKNTKPWRSEDPSTTNFFGGDLKGIKDNLDYLEKLGITGIYFTPVFKAKSNHKYDTIDYFKLDPQFGTKEDLKSLVKACHKRGIRVMLDAVFNHSGYHFKPFQDVLKKGENSKYKDWFHIKDFPVKTEPPVNYDTFGFFPEMPKLNTENQEVKDYLLDAAVYWIRECDIDGWRLDVANEVDHAFWREFRQRTREAKPDVYILGEIWHDAMPWLQGDQFDSVMNYPFTQAALNYGARQDISARDFAQAVVTITNLYPSSVNEVMFNLLGSHDTPRVLTEAGENTDRAMLLYVLLFMYPGTPCIYYGDEISMSGGPDPGCRACMVWDKEDQDRDMLHFIRTLIEMRREHSAFGNNGQLYVDDIFDDEDAVMFRKAANGEEIFFLLHAGEEDVPLNASTFNDRGEGEILAEKNIDMDEGTLTLHGCSFVIWK
ncbi:glycoside hydrolase family 13 protein [Alteribacillus sp. HJP-4]|uniref:glycoside hydrolase family 13 protein n=1 Tax=Alteribacillus sp. HJP-4 TaxID=2775394 RepID=UPI0035CD0932